MSPRPLSIRIFGWLLLAATVLGLGYLPLRYDLSGQEALDAALALMQLCGYNLVFWTLIARRANGLARWLYLALTGLALIGIAADWATYRGASAAIVVPTLGVITLQVLAALVLLRADAREWLAARGRLIDHDDIFR
ncbi:hypothetical protein MTR62_13150 [Novosphingobium sp. 1949]|uniref:Uncharacterized protein n=1 Tax=Novosphingobium organovorum TaxID=2930092 RepID=A0ABT0BFR2_9SPHN|nr:hypothetical protein [Novosphingobium organovorum]MCJ2183631.1 hypothetical protein [Novosphingobium organovorum]